MNKNQGFTIGAVLAAALFLRSTGPGGQETPAPPETGKTVSQAQELGSGTKEGPWIASCNYWAPARLAGAHPPRTPAEVHAKVEAKGKEFDLNAHLDEADETDSSACGNDKGVRWGFPETGSLDVTALIATVPDPVHTHLSLAFDRTIDALLQAAQDNGFVSTYYWLPWKNRGGGSKFAESQDDAEPGHGPERERQPGLIILRPPLSDWPDSFRKVVYVFLVSETPTQGVDGFQLQYAFAYENELEKAIMGDGRRFSRSRHVDDGKGTLAIVGPAFSGSVASLRAGIDAALGATGREFEISGNTTTDIAEKLDSKRAPVIRFKSFALNGSYSKTTLIDSLGHSGYDPARVAILVEDNTAAGSAATDFAEKIDKKESRHPIEIRFPREISLLRNAEGSSTQNASGSPSGGGSPYLHLSLKDYKAQDSIPQFSREITPLSQEAQLMAIARQLHRSRSQFIAIGASNALDQIFLAQFLHRACPDARLLFFGADLLAVREIDNVPFIGALTVTPYQLTGLTSARRAYPDSTSEAYYNAASYTFWLHNLSAPASSRDTPKLQGYNSLFESGGVNHPMLWATVIGRDGYYPLAILSPKPPLPDFGKGSIKPDESRRALVDRLAKAELFPSLMWAALWVSITLLCVLHAAVLFVADYWSPLTRDLAIQNNDHPWRRSTYVHVATAMLFSMAFLVSAPVLWLSLWTQMGPASVAYSIVTLAAGCLALFAAFAKTHGYTWWDPISPRPIGFRQRILRTYHRVHSNPYPVFNMIAWSALVGIVAIWSCLCYAGWSMDGSANKGIYLVGLCFSFRCIHPGSGVSPVLPILLLLFSWYLWGLFQTLRLRFSEAGRPQLPKRPNGESEPSLYVADGDLDQQHSLQHNSLYQNITSLLITRHALRRLLGIGPGQDKIGSSGIATDLVLAAIYTGLLIWLSVFSPVNSLDHFLWTHQHLACPYEFLAGALFFPLLAVGIAGWVRMILIWGALRRGLLERLENLPIRLAFSRLQVMGWVTMLRYGGVEEQWRDMARSLQSMRQILHEDDLRNRIPRSDWLHLQSIYNQLVSDIEGHRKPGAAKPYTFMHALELRFAAFSEYLLSTVMIPYWKDERSGLVESEESEDDPYRPRRVRALKAQAPDPPRILVAEEFLAIRYISMIRAVLANLGYLMIFVSLSFVLAVWSWNSYPFQPRQVVDWMFTALLAVLGGGVVWVFAQMHRNPILSRITDTRANQLGWDFYFRVASFGALPVLTWLAYQFPDIGRFISGFVQPSVPVIK